LGCHKNGVLILFIHKEKEVIAGSVNTSEHCYEHVLLELVSTQSLTSEKKEK